MTAHSPSDTHSSLNHPGTSVKGQQLDSAFWHSRVAVIASSQFPFVTVLGTKNNLVSRR